MPVASKPTIKCPHCEQTFKGNAGLATHVRLIHPNMNGTHKAGVSADPLKCDQCERTFETQQGLHLHRVRTHGAEKKPPLTRRRRTPRPKEEPTVVNISFCPCCGTNLQMLAHALAAIGGLK